MRLCPANRLDIKRTTIETSVKDEKRRPKPKEQIIREGLQPHPGPAESKEEAAIVESINVTSIEKNMHFFLSTAFKNALTVF